MSHFNGSRVIYVCLMVLILPFLGIQPIVAQDQQKTHKAAVHRYYTEVGNAADVETAMTAVDELLGVGFTFYALNDTTGIPGIDQHKVFLQWHGSAFAHQNWVVDDLISEGDIVAVRWTFTGIHEGEYLGISPTNNEVTIRGMDLFRFADGQIVELRRFFDLMDVMQQLGIILAPESQEADS